MKLVGLRLRDLVVVAMADAVLIADKSRAQDVKQVVLRLQEKQARQTETFPRDHRPWNGSKPLCWPTAFR